MVLRRFAILVVFFDAIFLAGLIISFRISTLEYLDNSTPDLVLKWIFVTNACIFYLLIRELGKSFSLSMFTGRTFFMEQFWSFWNFVDFFSILMALGSTIGMRVSFSNKSENGEHKYLRVCLALTIGFLWLRVLGLAKTVNVQLATFVLAIIQVS